MVHWQKSLTTSELLQHMASLNDRFALDGLSPPSYAGLLWCLGWCDKPWTGGSISTKPSSRYRVGSEGFAEAQKRLLEMRSTSIDQHLQRLHRSNPSETGDAIGGTEKRRINGQGKGEGEKKRRTIDSYFTPIKSPAQVK